MCMYVQRIPFNLPMLIWFGKPASESPTKHNKTRTVGVERRNIFLREVKSTPGLHVPEEKQAQSCTRACTQKEIHKMRRVPLSLAARAHVERVPAQLQRQSLCWCCWKPKASVLSQRWWWWTRKTVAFTELIPLKWATEGGREGAGWEWGRGRLSNLVWRWILIRAASRLLPRVTAELVCQALQPELHLVWCKAEEKRVASSRHGPARTLTSASGHVRV